MIVMAEPRGVEYLAALAIGYIECLLFEQLFFFFFFGILYFSYIFDSMPNKIHKFRYPFDNVRGKFLVNCALCSFTNSTCSIPAFRTLFLYPAHYHHHHYHYNSIMTTRIEETYITIIKHLSFSIYYSTTSTC